MEQAIVQLFVQTALLDWLEPYKTPTQLITFGTGFFIDSDGFVLTNFHVVSEAIAIQAQIPLLGKERFDLVTIGIYPERDIALLALTPGSKERFLELINELPYLPLGSSDRVERGETVFAYGYPLGQETLKITQGVISGYQDLEGEAFLQVTAPLNPGNSGGPCVNHNGEVIGINTSIIQEAQSIGYVVPIDDIKPLIKAMHKSPIIRRPVLGCDYNYSSPAMLKYLNNPPPGGVYINKVYKYTAFEAAQIKAGDMLYKINHHQLDLYGDTNVAWSNDKIHFTSLLHRFEIGEKIDVLCYRQGEKIETHIEFNMQTPLPIRQIFPEFENIVFEIIAGLVIMPLTLNHIGAFDNQITHLNKYCERNNQYESKLVISNIFQNSLAIQSRILEVGDIIDMVNEKKVSTIEDLYGAVKGCQEFISIKTNDGRLCVLDLQEALQEEKNLAQLHRYQPTALYHRLKGD